jgi:hypothetical protein
LVSVVWLAVSSLPPEDPLIRIRLGFSVVVASACYLLFRSHSDLSFSYCFAFGCPSSVVPLISLATSRPLLRTGRCLQAGSLQRYRQPLCCSHHIMAPFASRAFCHSSHHPRDQGFHWGVDAGNYVCIRMACFRQVCIRPICRIPG